MCLTREFSELLENGRHVAVVELEIRQDTQDGAVFGMAVGETTSEPE
jgi:hypothetical protein